MKVQDQVHFLQPLAVFADESLTAPGWVHFHDCPAVRGYLCRCGTATSTVRAPRMATVLQLTETSVQIQVDGLGPLWVERAGIAIGPLPNARRERLRSEAREARRVPPDYRVILVKLGDKPAPLVRSNRPVRGGDLCWIRGQERTLATLRRYLCRTRGEADSLEILLVRPDLFPGQALSPTWADLHRIPASQDQRPEHHLVSAFGALSLPQTEGWTEQP